jgi:type I restriction enzyme R subunit
LLKYADAKRVLFLVDTKNLGVQAEQEFMTYLPNDGENRKFVELYNVQRLTSSFIAKDSQVCISTIQRMYSLLFRLRAPNLARAMNSAKKSPISPQKIPNRSLPNFAMNTTRA